MVGQRLLERGTLSDCPYGAASSPKGRAKVASLRKNDTAKLQFVWMLREINEKSAIAGRQKPACNDTLVAL